MDCSLIVRNEFAEKYLLGTLSSTEREQYERHFFECTRCAHELEQLVVLQEALHRSPPVPDQVASRPRWARGSRWAVAIALAASVAGIALMLRQADRPEPGLPVPSVSTESPVARLPGADVLGSTPPLPRVYELPSGPTSPVVEESALPPVVDRSRQIAAALQRLSRVSPPSYHPIVLRGTTDEASALFREGMRAYVAGDYQAAAAELERAAKLDSSRPDIAYFLGIARLMNGNTAEAIGALERTIAMGDSPFLGDAHFYLAKAHLTDGDVASARSELEAAAALAGGGQSEAVRLLSDLNELDLR